MSKPVLGQDQSVEEILASIRQAIAADQSRRGGQQAGATRPVPAPHPVASPEHQEEQPPPSEDMPQAAADRSRMHDVIEDAIERALDGVDPEDTRAETADTAARPAARAQTPSPRVNGAAGDLRGQRQAAAPRQVAPATPARSLISPRADAAVSASFDDLSRAIALRAGRDIDQTVEDLLRPMLKSWLDENLPPLVEKLVREEIERVSRGRR
jgi:cell pole-organizing protein PopZ